MILHGSFHQGDERFNIDSHGKQCTGIAAVAWVAFFLLHPNTWTLSDKDYVVKLGDRYYRENTYQEQDMEYLAMPFSHGYKMCIRDRTSIM